MKKFLTITAIVLLVGFLAMYAFSWMQVQSNDDTLAEIKNTPGVVVLDVTGMT